MKEYVTPIGNKCKNALEDIYTYVDKEKMDYNQYRDFCKNMDEIINAIEKYNDTLLLLKYLKKNKFFKDFFVSKKRIYETTIDYIICILENEEEFKSQIKYIKKYYERGQS